MPSHFLLNHQVSSVSLLHFLPPLLRNTRHTSTIHAKITFLIFRVFAFFVFFFPRVFRVFAPVSILCEFFEFSRFRVFILAFPSFRIFAFSRFRAGPAVFTKQPSHTIRRHSIYT